MSHQTGLLQLPLAESAAPPDDESRALAEFVQLHAQNFQPALDQPAAAVARLVSRLTAQQPGTQGQLPMLCLRALRLACRHRANLEACPADLLDATLACLMGRAGLTDGKCSYPGGLAAESPPPDAAELTESLMCLCNLCILMDGLVPRLVAMRCHAGLLRRARACPPADLDRDWPTYDLRLLFLLAAKCDPARRELRQEMQGLACLTQLLAAACASAAPEQPLGDRRCDLLCDLLKLLYTLACTPSGAAGPDDKATQVEGETDAFHQLAALLRRLLLLPCGDRRDRLAQHCVSLLLCLPGDCYDSLLTNPTLQPRDTEAATHEDSPSAGDPAIFEGKGVEAIDIVLAFLDKRLALFDGSCLRAEEAGAAPPPGLTGGAMENLVPALSALYECCRCSRTIRRYCKARILPKRRGRDQLCSLPEEGASIGSRLCRALTHPCTQAADMAAYLVHVLCKGSLARAVRYTGYGNFAGFLARRGLMAGGPGRGDAAAEAAAFSSDSSSGDEGADEERAEDGAHASGGGLIYNPITGRREPPRQDPTAGMTDEQKEFEVHKVMQAIDRLQATGVISPAVIGEDGRPCPVSHPLELVERLSQQHRRGRPAPQGDGSSSSEED